MYRIIFGLLYLLSLLPMWLLYGLSDGLAFLLCYVIRYRRRVVLANLQIAFPEKTGKERGAIAGKFYRNFTDNFIETLKLFSASEAFIRKRFVIDNPEVLEGLYNSGRKCQLLLGHTFNWELANVAMPFLTRYLFLVVYMPIENKIIDRLFRRLRGRTGTILLPATNMVRTMLPYRNEQYALTLVADQAPPDPKNAYWLNFFGQPTAFIRSPERGGRGGDIPTVFTRLYRSRRGHYRVHFTSMDHPGQSGEGELTKWYARLLEEAIRQNPDLWLWSHKRWKSQWREEFSRLRID